MSNLNLFNMFNMNITDRIVATMQQHGIKQVDLVNKAKVSKGTVSLWVKGQTVPSGENLIKLATALGVTPEWLQTGKESRNRVDYDGTSEEERRQMKALATMMLPITTPNSNRDLQRIIDALDSGYLGEEKTKEISMLIKVIADRFIPEGNE